MNTEYLNFCPRLKQIIESGTSITEKGATVKISATSTLNNLRVIREIILQQKPTNTLEIGLAYGVSALTILSTLKEYSQEGYCHSAVDPFQSTDWGGSSLRVIKEEGFSEAFKFYEEFSAYTLPKLIKEDKKYDFIYIDGSHLFEDVFLDFYFSAILLNIDGIVLFDDCSDKHINKVLKFIRRNYKGILKEIKIGHFEDPNKSLIKRIGNSLGIRQLVGFKKIYEPPRAWDIGFTNF